MSKINLEIIRLDVKEILNYFMVIQLDEIEFPSGLRKTQKYRTEIELGTNYPTFHKNNFEFNKIQMGNRIVLKVGLFSTNITCQDAPSDVLFRHSHLLGTNEIIFTASIFEMMRNHKWIENDLRLYNPESQKESGYTQLRIHYETDSLDAKIYNDNKEIATCFHDPFEEDEEIIRNKLKKIVLLNETRQFKLDDVYRELDEVNKKVKYLAVDKSKVLRELEELKEENNILTKNLDKLQNYDEIHIEVDILSQSNQGVNIIEKKYSILLSQFAMQKQSHFELEKEYEKIDTILSKIKIIKEKIDENKLANQELKFNIKRHEDMLPLITAYEEKIKNREKVIENLNENIKKEIEKNQMNLNGEFSNIGEINSMIQKIYKERQMLEEKKLQLNLYNNMYNNEYSDEIVSNGFLRIIKGGYDPIMNKIIKESETNILKDYNSKILSLNNEINELSLKLNNFNEREKMKAESFILIDPNIIIKKRELSSKIELLDNKEKVLIEELDSSNLYYKTSINSINERIRILDQTISREINLSKYETNNYKQIRTPSSYY
jgi:hypothetical protein